VRGQRQMRKVPWGRRLRMSMQAELRSEHGGSHTYPPFGAGAWLPATRPNGRYGGHKLSGRKVAIPHGALPSRRLQDISKMRVILSGASRLSAALRRDCA
jgi:hypothetical protein